MQEYDRQHGVTDLWSRAQEASRRYSTSTGDSELASLEESLGANLTRMQRFEDRAALSYGESEQWSEQAAAVRADARSIERELGQPFFAWLAERAGTDGRPIGAGGAMRLASPQTPEDAEALREHAAAFIAERFPAPAGPDPASASGRAEYEVERASFGDAHGPAAAAAHAGWAEGVRDRAAAAGAPDAGEVGAKAGTHRAAAKATLRSAGRSARRVRHSRRMRSAKAAPPWWRSAIARSASTRPRGCRSLATGWQASSTGRPGTARRTRPGNRRRTVRRSAGPVRTGAGREGRG